MRYALLIALAGVFVLILGSPGVATTAPSAADLTGFTYLVTWQATQSGGGDRTSLTYVHETSRTNASVTGSGILRYDTTIAKWRFTSIAEKSSRSDFYKEYDERVGCDYLTEKQVTLTGTNPWPDAKGPTAVFYVGTPTNGTTSMQFY